MSLEDRGARRSSAALDENPDSAGVRRFPRLLARILGTPGGRNEETAGRIRGTLLPPCRTSSAPWCSRREQVEDGGRVRDLYGDMRGGFP